ncbi:MAG: helix-turn-helix transcriptional regulator [Deltaproteobacteria bacterium]|nr:helix-turn-helix transcriptional regulator [Deltaproteobacteria bacterium]
MKALKNIRRQRGISQRRLAARAGTSFKTLQLLETEGKDCRLSTLESLATGLGYPQEMLSNHLAQFWELPVDSVAVASYSMQGGVPAPWRLPFFNFVDAFRKAKDPAALVRNPPLPATPRPLQALLASTVEALCTEAKIPVPDWCEGIPILDRPWFVSEVENLKASALVESLAHFRKRNIFVLENFLSRA